MPATMCATLAEPHAPGTDLVFCVPLAIAWKRLTERFGPLRMDPQPALADALNEMLLDPDAVDPAWCVAGAGFGGEGILERLRAELAAKFPGASPSMLPASIAPDGLLAYGYLSRALRFPTVFAVREGYFLGRPVRAFGLTNSPPSREIHEARLRQVVVHDYVSAEDFVIELLHGEGDDRIVIAQAPPRESLGATARSALDRLGMVREEYASLRPDEELSIPRLELDEARSFSDLAGRPLRNEGIGGKGFDEAKQSVRFTLDEGGASVRAEAVLVAFGPPQQKRSFVVCRPFLVMLIRRGSFLPYLTLWVETPAWMQAQGNPAAAAGPAPGLPPGIDPSMWKWGPPS